MQFYPASKLFDVATLDHGCESVRQLVHDHLGYICATSAWNVTVSNAVFGNEDIYTTTGSAKCLLIPEAGRNIL